LLQTGEQAVSGAFGDWSFEVSDTIPDALTGDTLDRLNPEDIEDMAVISHYSVAAA
jgi:hypothetical protein